MRTRQDPLFELLEPSVADLGYELWGIERVGQGNGSVLRLYIDDAENGISVDDCAKVSRQVSAVLDVEDAVPGQYMLEVSSPGLDRQLFSEAHIEKFRGHRAQVKLDTLVEGRRQVTGLLNGIQDAYLKVVDDDDYEWELPVEMVHSVHLVPVISKAKR